jgi:tetratricopeptide (TPR) repeat protein
MLNTLAWTLATCPNQALRDPSKALELAQQACALTQSKHPGHLNTLAVAYVRLKDFSEAVKISEKAVALAQAKGDQTLVTKLQKQLDLIKRALAESK